MRRVVGRTLRRLAILLRGGRAQREIDEELGLHVDLEAEELVRQGMSPAAARREAMRRFGGVDRHREAAREARGTAGAEDWLHDVRYALRTLARSPGFTAAALVTLGLGIGSSTAIFSVVNAVVLRPLPYEDPPRVVSVRPGWEGTELASLSPAEYLDLVELDVFEHLGVYAFGSVNVTGGGEPERLQAAFLSHGVLPALGIAPRPGRSFSVEEDEGSAHVALLSHALWTRRFAADPSVVGRSVLLNGTAYEVLGVLPASFSLPEDLASADPSDVYLPLGISPTETRARGSHFLSGVARLAAGVSPEAADAAVAREGERMVAAYPDDYPREMAFRVSARPLADEVVGPARPALRLLVGAVAFLLLVSCANVANLQLARAEGRERELGLRSALGAGRRRLFRQILLESLVLGLLASALGAVLAGASIEALLALQPPEVPRLEEVRLDGAALLFAVALAVLTSLAFGLIPAARAAMGDPLETFRGARGSVEGGRAGRARDALVVVQLSAAVVLLTGGALLARTLLDLVRSDPGYRTEGVLTAEITLPAARYADASEVSAFFQDLVTRLRSLPGAMQAGGASNLPLATSLGDLNFRIEGRPVAEGDVSPRADWQAVTPGYLEAMGIDVLRGRPLDERDRPDAPGAVVISRTTAERYWPGGDALGERFVLGGGAGPGEVTVVGVVEDVAHEELGAAPSAQMYLAHAQFRFWGSGEPVRSMDVVLRAQGPAADLAPQLRDEVRALDPSLPVSGVRTMEEVVSASLAQPRLLASLVAAFAAMALVLASVGLYGVIAYVVGRRRQEFGIRMALGAGGSQVVGMVVRRGALLVASGLVVGVAASVALSRGASGALYGVVNAEATTLAAVSALLGAVALLAIYIPARRATRVDPVSPLRGE